MLTTFLAVIAVICGFAGVISAYKLFKKDSKYEDTDGTGRDSI